MLLYNVFIFPSDEKLLLVFYVSQTSEEILFDQVAQFLYKGTLKYARKELSLYLFAEWSRSNMDIIFQAITSIKMNEELNKN